jgi:LuxR family maltose regulon positive regulatory protein
MLDSLIRVYLPVAEWLCGRLPEAERAFGSSITRWRVAGEAFWVVRVCELLGLVQRALGRLDAAVATYSQALDIAAPPGRPPLAGAGIGHVGLAEVAYQRNELDAALRTVSEGVALCRQFSYIQPLATGLATLAWIRQATGDLAGSREAMSDAWQLAAGPAGLLNPVPAQRARLLLAQGDVVAAARWTQESGLEPDDDPVYTREPGYLVLARVLLAQGQPARALALLDRLHAAALTQDRTGSLIEVGALRALALAATGEETAAMTVLAGTLSLACPQGYVRVFADEGPPMAALLGKLIAAQRTGHAAAGVPLGCLARLRRAFGAEPAATVSGRGTAAVPGLVERLTGRELEVLGMLAAGRSNQAIAGQLVVTLDTVKKHVSHVLDKLGAGNRTEAVARAGELGLIP